MGTGYKSLFSAGLFLTAVFALQAQDLNSAKALFDQQKYAECAKALEKDVQRPDASEEILKLAFQANMKAGNPISASIVAGELLKKTKKPSADLLYDAGEAAELAGDEKMALSRYHAFTIHPDAKDKKKLFRSCKYLLGRDFYPDVFAVYVQIENPGFCRWMAMDYFEKLSQRADMANFIKLAPVIIPAFKDDTEVIWHFLMRINNVRTQLGSDQEPLISALLEATYPKMDLGQLYDYVRFQFANGGFDAAKKFRLAMKYMDANPDNVPWDDVFLIPSIQFINSREKPENKVAAAKEFFSYYKNYLKSDNADRISSFASTAAGADPVAFAFVKPEQLAALVNRTRELSNVEFYNTNFDGITNAAVNVLYKDKKAEQIEYLKAAIPTLSPGWANELFARDISGNKGENGNILRYLNANPGPFTKEIKGFDMLNALRENSFKKRSYDTITNFVAMGLYDPGTIASQAAGTGLTAAESVKAVAAGAALSGSTPRLKALVAAMENNATLKADPGFAALKAFAESNKPGSDPVLTAAARAFSIDANQEHAAELEKAIADFLQVFKGNVPSIAMQSANLQEYAAYRLLQNNFNLVNNRDCAKRLVQAWFPRMKKPGQGFHDVLWRSLWYDGNNRKGGFFWDTLQLAVPVLAAAGYDQESIISELRNFPVNKEKKDFSLLEPIYALYPYESLGYIAQNCSEWTPEFTFKQMNSLLMNPKVELKRNVIEEMRNVAVNGPHKNAIPTELLINLMTKYVDFANKNNYYNFNWELEFIRPGKKEQQPALFEAYANLNAQRPPEVRQDAVNIFAWQNQGLDSKTMMMFLEKTLRPLIDSGYFKTATNAALNVHVLVVLNRVMTDKDASAELKAAAESMHKALRQSLYARTTVPNRHDVGSFDMILSPYLEEAVAAANGDPLMIARSAAVLADVLAAQTGAWSGMQSADKGWAALKDKATDQTKYAFLSSFSSGNSDFAQNAKNKYMMEISKLAKVIPGIIPVDKTNPAYDIYVAANLKKEGNALHAWSLIKERFPVLTQRWKEFDFEFVLWALDMARIQKMYKEAIELSQTLWIDESKLSPEYAAQLALIKGDIYRDQKNYPIARLEYESLKNSPRCAKTPAGRMAKFRLVELLILTEDFSAAQTMLERLIDSPTTQDQAEAYYLMARLSYNQKEFDQTKDYLKEVFNRVNDHVEGRLLEGLVMLQLGRITDEEIILGRPELATIINPGRPVNIVIIDNNLGVVRGGSSLPVLVTTTDGKDREIIELLPNATDINKFGASVPTALGKAVPGNGMIELNGRDTVVYQIDPDFQKANNIVRPAQKLEVRSAAKLYAASQQILSEDAQDDIKFQRDMAMSGGRSFRDFGKTIRPGNSIYIRVIDPDMSLHTDKPDTVKVDLLCNSGDELNGFVLTETGNSTGVFEAKVPTGIPFPNVSVSSSPEGQDINAVINSTKNGSWTSDPSAGKPQWIEVDTMTSSLFKEIDVTVPNPDAVKSLKLFASLDGSDELLCSFPTNDKEKIRGGMDVMTLNSTAMLARQDALVDFFRKKRTDEPVWVRNPVAYRNLTNSPRKQQDGWVSTMMTGAFYIPENMEIEFKFMQAPNDQQNCYLLLDGVLALGGRMNSMTIASTKLVQLQKGVHQIVIFANDYSKTSSIQLGMMQNDGSAVPLPGKWFNPELNPQLQEYLRPKGKIEKTKQGFQVKLDTQARYRKFKWQFDDFTGTQIEVKSISALDSEGHKILPVENDLSSGKTNGTLEIAPADLITIKYNDERRLDDNKAILTDELSSSFSDGRVNFSYEEILLDDEGQPHSRYSEAVRARKGDAVIVEVNEPDANISEEQETIPVTITTSSGEKLEIKALEMEEKFGIGRFREVVKFGDVTDPSKNMIKLNPGDKVTASYLDTENNRPGIPVERKAYLINSDTNRAAFHVFSSRINWIEDRSESALAKIKMMRDKGDKRTDIKIMKETIDASMIETGKDKTVIPIVNTKTPLLFELICPDQAKHTDSSVNIEVLSDTEIKAAEKEQRPPVPLIVKSALQPLSELARAKGYLVNIHGRDYTWNLRTLSDGVFSGIVRLQLGSAGDDVNDVIANNETFNLMNAGTHNDSNAFKIPTVIVSGSDKVYLVYKNAEGKEMAKQTVQLRSDGEIELYDKNYLTPNHEIHLGQNFFVRVYDPDRDLTNERDTVEVDVVGKVDSLKMKLSETLPHSGIFTGSLRTDLKPKPLAGQTEPKKLEDNVLWTTFGDKVKFTYTDVVPLDGDKPVALSTEGSILLGSNAEVAVFTKKFKDPEMAVKTNFLMAEALFEMAKSHKAMKDKSKEELAKEEIAKGKRVLEEALRDYPDTALKAQGEFLLANLAQQLEKYSDAIGLYSSVLSRYPDSEYAVKSQFQKAVCLEKIGQFVPACEEYVKLTYLYPENKLAADAKLRLANHYYKQKNYKSSASIFRKFAENHHDHPLASKGLLLAGYSAVKFEEQKTEVAKEMKTDYKPDYTLACSIFQELVDQFPDDKITRPEAMYRLGDLLFKIGTTEARSKSFQTLQTLIWDYPETRWAKFARGRLAERPREK